MINMRYCRFRNTHDALRECIRETESWSLRESYPSDAEHMEAMRLILLCKKIADDYADVIARTGIGRKENER